MKARFFWAVIMLLGFLAISCRQDSIFFTISKETAPRKPRIEGSPTNMVVFKRNGVDIMYVTSGRLHWYAHGQWGLSGYAIPQPGGNISALAATRDRLYALCWNSRGVKSTLRYIESNGNTWETVSNGSAEYPIIQSIYADPESTWLIAGAGKSDNNKASYGILYLKDNANMLTIFKGDTSLLSGAACREEEGEEIYYLSTRGDGIFQTKDFANVIPLIGDDRVFMSMIKLEDTIFAVERDEGILHKIHYGSAEQMSQNTGRYATEAIALWQDPERNLKLLIVGRQSDLYYSTTSSQTFGYVEFVLNEVNNVVSFNNQGSLQSVDDNARYAASLGKHPVNHLFQAPSTVDPARTFFASTQTKGLWSYRNRSEGWQWNAEE